MITVKHKNIEVFTFGKYTFYTDKHAITVRVPRATAPKNDTQGSAFVTDRNKKKISEFNYTPSHDGKWFDLKELYCPECDGYTGRWHICSPYVRRPALLVCDICGGTGRRLVCPECDGCGRIDIANSYNEYNVTCQTCNGKGIATDPKNPDGLPCFECDSTGDRGYANYGYVRLRHDYNEYLNAAYLDALVELPGIQIFMPRLEGYSIFRFDGGSAILMGMVPPAN